VAAAVTQLLGRRDQLFSPSGPAALVARRIGRTFPLLHGADGLGAVAATRWKTQINENAKSPAFVGVEPELCHNELAGWGQDGDVTRQVLTLIQLRMAHEHPQIERRQDLVAEILLEVMAEVIEVRGEGEGDLAQFFDLAYFGDVTSLFLAGAESLDPGPIPTLGEVKEALRQA
jgi:glucose/mannose-6-phosphate isomerase